MDKSATFPHPGERPAGPGPEAEARAGGESEALPFRLPGLTDPHLLIALVDRLPVGVLVAEAPSGRVVACNEAYRTLCPGTPALGSQCVDFAEGLGGLHPDGRKYRPEEFPLARAIAGERVEGEEIETLREGGQRRVLRVSAVPLGDGSHAVATVDDVTDGRLFREAQQAARARDETMSVVSHDLRNSLHAALLNMELVLDVSPAVTPDSPSWRRIAAVRRSLQHMHRLVQDLLEADRIGRGRLTIRPERLDPARVATEVEEVFGPLARDSRVELHVRVAPGVPALHADPSRLMQVLNNLISNALHATPAGGRVEVGIEPEEEGMARIRVADTGAGMSEQELEQVFDRFYQGASARHTGVGLGLSIVRGIVEAHGGRVWVRSRPGEGSEFCFTMPG